MSSFNLPRQPDNKASRKTVQPSTRPSIANVSTIGRENINLNNILVGGQTISVDTKSITYLNATPGVAGPNEAVVLDEDKNIENIGNIGASELYVNGTQVTGIINRGATVSNSIYLNNIQPGIGKENKIVSASEEKEISKVNISTELAEYNGGKLDTDFSDTVETNNLFETEYSFLKLDEVVNFATTQGNVAHYNKFNDLFYCAVASTTGVFFVPMESLEKSGGGNFFSPTMSLLNSHTSTTNNPISQYIFNEYHMCYNPVLQRYIVPFINGTNCGILISQQGHPSTWASPYSWASTTIGPCGTAGNRSPCVKFSPLTNTYYLATHTTLYSSPTGIDNWATAHTYSGTLIPFIICTNDMILLIIPASSAMIFSTDGTIWSTKTFTSQFAANTSAIEYVPELDAVCSASQVLRISTFLSLPATGNTYDQTFFPTLRLLAVNMGTYPFGKSIIIQDNKGENIWGLAGAFVPSNAQRLIVANFKKNTVSAFNHLRLIGDKVYMLNFQQTTFAQTRALRYSLDANNVRITNIKKVASVEPEVFLDFEPCSRVVVLDFEWSPTIGKYIAIGFGNDAYGTTLQSNVYLYYSDNLEDFKFVQDLGASTYNRIVVEESTGFVYCFAIDTTNIMIFTNYGIGSGTFNSFTAGTIRYAYYVPFYGVTILGTSQGPFVICKNIRINSNSLTYTVGSIDIYENRFSIRYANGTTHLNSINALETMLGPSNTVASNIIANRTQLAGAILYNKTRGFVLQNISREFLTDASFSKVVYIEPLGIIVRVRNNDVGQGTALKLAYTTYFDHNLAASPVWVDVVINSVYTQRNNAFVEHLKYDTNSGRLYILGNYNLQRTKISLTNLSLDNKPFMKNPLSSYYSREDSGYELIPFESGNLYNMSSSTLFNGMAYSCGDYVLCGNGFIASGKHISNIQSTSLAGTWNSVSSSLNHFVVAGNNRIAVSSTSTSSSSSLNFNIITNSGIDSSVWNSVNYSDRLKVWSMCADGKWAFSLDAVSWNIIDVVGNWKNIKYANGYWLAVGLNRIAYLRSETASITGIPTVVNIVGDWRDFDFGGRWLITGYGRSIINTNFNDLDNWQTISSLNGRNFNSVSFVEGLSQFMLAGEHYSTYILSLDKTINYSSQHTKISGRTARQAVWMERYKSIIMVGNGFWGSRTIGVGLDSSFRSTSNSIVTSSTNLLPQSYLKVTDYSNGLLVNDGMLSSLTDQTNKEVLSLKNTTTGETSTVKLNTSGQIELSVPSSLSIISDNIKINSITMDNKLDITKAAVSSNGVAEAGKFLSTDSSGNITGINNISAGGLIVNNELYVPDSNTSLDNLLQGVGNNVIANKAVRADASKNINNVNTLSTNSIQFNNVEFYESKGNKDVAVFSNMTVSLDGSTTQIYDVCYCISLDLYVATTDLTGILPANVSSNIEKYYVLLSKDGINWYKQYVGVNYIFRYVIPAEKLTSRARTGFFLIPLNASNQVHYSPDGVNFYLASSAGLNIPSLSTNYLMFEHDSVSDTFVLLDQTVTTTSRLLTYTNNTLTQTAGANISNIKKAMVFGGTIIVGLAGNTRFNSSVGSTSTITGSTVSTGTINDLAFARRLDGVNDRWHVVYAADGGRILYNTNNVAPNDAGSALIVGAEVVLTAGLNFTRVTYNSSLRRFLTTASNGRIFISDVGSQSNWTEVTHSFSSIFNMEWTTIKSLGPKGFALMHNDNSIGRINSKICTVNESGVFNIGYTSLVRTYDQGAYGNGVYVIPVNQDGLGHKIAYSDDGINWNFSFVNSNRIRKSLFVSSLGLFIIGEGSRVYSSPDGIDWTLRYTNPTGGSVMDIELAGNNVVVLFSGITTNQLAYSSNLTTWNTSSVFSSQSWSNAFVEMKYSTVLNRLILVVDNANNTPAIYTDNLTTFTACISLDSDASTISPIGRNIMWLKEENIFAMTSTARVSGVWVSSDGIQWTRNSGFLNVDSNVVVRPEAVPTNSAWIPNYGDVIINGGSWGRSSNILSLQRDTCVVVAPASTSNIESDYSLCIYNNERNQLLVYKSIAGGRSGDVFILIDLEEAEGKITNEICVDYLDKMYYDKPEIEDYMQTNNIQVLANSTLDGGALNSASINSNLATLANYSNKLDNLTFNKLLWVGDLNMLFICTNIGIITSSDGINFTTLLSDFVATSLCWSPELDLLVAVRASGTGGRIATSSNGFNWTIINSTNDAMSWNKVIWANGFNMFVACSSSTGVIAGDNNKIMTSTDGITWTSRATANNSLGYMSMDYSPLFNSIFGYTSTATISFSSINGINWFNSTITTYTGAVRDIVWSSKFKSFVVAIGASNSGILHITNGGSLRITITTARNIQDIDWSPELDAFLIAFSDASHMCLLSDINAGIYHVLLGNGSSAPSVTASNSRVAWCPPLNSAIFAFSQGVDRLKIYTDFRTTNTRAYDIMNTNTWNACEWSPTLNRFVSGGSGTEQILYSNNGSEWYVSNYNNPSTTITSICWSNTLNLFVAVSNTGTNRLLRSSNGLDWTESMSPTNINGNLSLDSTWTSICWSNDLNLFVAVANSGSNRIIISSDGINWSVPTTNSLVNSLELTDVCWSPSLTTFVAVASTNTYQNIIRSFDGITWSPVFCVLKTLISVCWSAPLNMFVAVGTNGSIVTSTNGDDWISRTNPYVTTATLSKVIWASTKFVLTGFMATGNFGIIMESRDGILWESSYALGAINQFRGITYSPSLNEYVAVSSLGNNRITNITNSVTNTIRTSPPTYQIGPTSTVVATPSADTSTWRDILYVPTLSPPKLYAIADVDSTTQSLNVSTNFGASWISETTVSIGNRRTLAFASYRNNYRLFAGNYATTGGAPFIMANGTGGTFSTTSTNNGVLVRNITSIAVSEELQTTVVVRDTATPKVGYSVGPDSFDNIDIASVDETAQWNHVIWVSPLKLFVAVARSGTTRCMTSPDGINWSAVNLTGGLATSAWVKLCWSNKFKLIVAIATSGSSTLMTSPDGINWTSVGITNFIGSTRLRNIIWCPGIDMFIGSSFDDNVKLSYSRNIIDWYQIFTPTSASSVHWEALCWLPDRQRLISASGAPTSRFAYFDFGPTPMQYGTLNTAPTVNFSSVVWSPQLSIYVAVASSGTDRIYSSTNGRSFSAATVQAGINSCNWRSVCWSPELTLFVAVANVGTNRVAVSSDGINWTFAVDAVADARDLQSVCWSPELSRFVAVANGGGGERAISSSNGTVWTAASAGAGSSNAYVSVCWSPELGIFVAVASGGTGRIIRSSNGTSWTASTSADAQVMNLVCWSNGLRRFITFTNTTGALSSNDGITWQATSGLPINVSNIVWAEEISLFVAVSTASTAKLATSADGITWNISSTGNNTASWSAICWSPEQNRFVMLSVGTGTATNLVVNRNNITPTYPNYSALTPFDPPRQSTSINGSNTLIARTAFASPLETAGWSSICWSPDLGIYCAIATAGTNRVAFSSNGTSWTLCNSDIMNSTGWNSICWSSKLRMFLVVSSSAARPVAISYDGVRWNTIASTTIGTSATMLDVLFIEELNTFVTATNLGFFASNDGINWTVANPSLSGTSWTSIAWSRERQIMVAVSTNGTTSRFAWSLYGYNWVALSIGNSATWSSVAWSPRLNLFVAVASSGTNRLGTSSDGLNWTFSNARDTVAFRSIVWADEIQAFVAVADGGTVFESIDGTTWTTAITAFTTAGHNYRDICWSPLQNKFIAVSNAGTNRFIEITALQSPQTITAPSTPASETTLGTTIINLVCNDIIVTDIAYSSSLGLYIGCGTSTQCRIVYSYDAKTWFYTRGTVQYDFGIGWASVTWDAALNLFVAVANAGNTRLATSSNGLDWIGISGFVNTWTCITNSNGMIIAISSDGWYLRTINGIDWESAFTGFNQSFIDITYSASLDRFVAVSISGTNRVIYSTNGTSWTSTSTTVSNLQAVRWISGMNIFIALSGTAGANSIATSSNGISWTTLTLTGTLATMNWKSVDWIPTYSMLVLAEEANPRIVFTKNLTDWVIKRLIEGAATTLSLMWNSTRNELVVSYNVALRIHVLTTADFVTPTLPFKVKWDVAWSKALQRFVAFKKVDPLTNDNQFMISRDGYTWSLESNQSTISGLDATSRLRAVSSYTEIPEWDMLITCKNTGHIIAFNTRVINQITVSGGNVSCVFYSNALGCVIAGMYNTNSITMINMNRNAISSSTIARTLPISITVKEIALCNGNHIILPDGETNSYLYSYDINTFFTGTLPFRGNWKFASRKVRGNYGRVVAVSSKGIIITSIDGINWSVVRNYNVLETQGSRSFASVKYIEELNIWVAVDEVKKTNACVYSRDGINWADLSFASPVSLCDFAFSAYLDVFVFLSLPDTPTQPIVTITTLPKIPTQGNTLKTEAFGILPNGGLYTGTTVANTFLSQSLENFPLIALGTNSAYKPSTSTWTINSDERLKKDIEEMDIDECLRLIEQLELKYYKWKDEFAEAVQEEDKHKLGFIAQEVEAVMPQAVYNLGNLYNYEDVKSINTDQIIATLYGAIQALIKRYESLKNKLENMN